MAGLLAGKVAVVTGGAGGIGRGICVRFAEEGAKAVIVADMREEPREGGQPTTALVEAAGAQAAFVATDVSKPAQLVAAVEAASAFGGLDVMVNNAGVYIAEDFLTVSEDDYDRLMDINVKGTYFGAQAAMNAMRDRGGAIINLSSIGGIRGSGASVAYCTSKGAVRLMTYSLAQVGGPLGIRVNALHPGLIDTPMNRVDTGYVGPDGEGRGSHIPIGRVGQPRDIADAAVYLASDLASFVSGTSLIVDGGQMSV